MRAYPTGVGGGDEGYVGNLELRYHTIVPGLTPSAYFDMGHVKNFTLFSELLNTKTFSVEYGLSDI